MGLDYCSTFPWIMIMDTNKKFEVLTYWISYWHSFLFVPIVSNLFFLLLWFYKWIMDKIHASHLSKIIIQPTTLYLENFHTINNFKYLLDMISSMHRLIDYTSQMFSWSFSFFHIYLLGVILVIINYWVILLEVI